MVVRDQVILTLENCDKLSMLNFEGYVPVSIELFIIRVEGLETSRLADLRILIGQEYKPNTLSIEGYFISCSTSPGETGLKAKDS